MWLFIFDWQVVLILPHSEDFSHRLTSSQPRDYRVVFFVQKYEVVLLSATSSQSAIKFVTSRHLGTKWCGWFSTRPKALFDPLIGHFDPLISVVQFRPLIFHKSTGYFRPMISSSVSTKSTQNCVYLSCFLRVCSFLGSKVRP